MGFSDSFTRGIQAGTSLANSISRNQIMDKELQWKQEDRDREEQDRKQLMAVGATIQKMDSGDFSPAIALANSSGMFGEGRFAAGAKMDDKGNIVAHVYDTSDPVWSMSEIPLGTAKDVRNRLIMSQLPQRYLGQIQAQQAAKYADPMQQAQLQGAQADAATKTAHAQYAAPAALAGLQAEQAKVGLIGAQTNAANAQTGRTTALTGPEVAKTRAEADLMRARANAPTIGRPLATVTSDLSDDSTVRENIYDPKDPRLQQNRTQSGQALQGAAPATTAGQATGQSTFKSADEVKAAYKAGKITKAQAVSILRQQFRMQ